LRLSQAQWQRILQVALYFVQITVGDTTLHKIGVTSRPLDERIREIRQELRPLCGAVTIQVLGTWPHRGNVELYFKHRYREARYRIGPLTEYFRWTDVAPVLRDLQRLPPKTLRPIERDLLADVPSAFAQRLAADAARRAAAHVAAHRAAAIQRGMSAAAERGVHIGRPAGATEPAAAFLAKPASQRVMAALEQGCSLRHAAQAAGVAVNTVRKVALLLKTLEQARS
jgi:hypothetical protein